MDSGVPNMFKHTHFGEEFTKNHNVWWCLVLCLCECRTWWIHDEYMMNTWWMHDESWLYYIKLRKYADKSMLARIVGAMKDVFDRLGVCVMLWKGNWSCWFGDGKHHGDDLMRRCQSEYGWVIRVVLDETDETLFVPGMTNICSPWCEILQANFNL